MSIGVGNSGCAGFALTRGVRQSSFPWFADMDRAWVWFIRLLAVVAMGWLGLGSAQATVIFAEDFNGPTNLDATKWTVKVAGGDPNSPYYGTSRPAAISFASGRMNVAVPGGANGYMGIPDGSVFTPIGATATGDYEVTIGVEELLRQQAGADKDNSGVSLVAGDRYIAILGNYSGYFTGYNYGAYNKHRIQAGGPSGNCVHNESLELTTLYALELRISRAGGNVKMGYRLAGQPWVDTQCGVQDGAVSPHFQVTSGDGGGTTQNGQFTAAVDYFQMADTSQPVAPTDMVAYYCFDDPANLGKDCSANGNNGTVSGGVSAVSGVSSGGALFGGVNSPGVIHVPNSPSLQFGMTSTLSYFVKIDDPAGMDGWGSFSAHGNFAVVAKSHDRSGLVWNTSIDATDHLGSGFGGFNGVNTIAGTDVFNGWASGAIGRWVHVVHVVDSVGLKTYMDGQLVWSQNGTVDFSTANTQDLYIGKFSDYWYPLNGTLDEIKIFQRALSIEEIQALFALGGGVLTTISPITPAAARLDVLQTFTLTGTGFTPGTTVAVADCTNDTSYVPSPANTATTITFRCTPTLPGPKTVSVNGTLVAGTIVNVDHPTRLGNAGARGIPSVNATSLWNGNVHLEATDLAVPGKGVSFALTRSYNSYDFSLEANRGSVSQAAPWRFNWDLKLGYVGTDTSKLWVQREDGSGENFIKDATDGIWYPVDQGNFNTLKVDTPVAGQTTLLTREGLKYIFQNPVVGGTGGLLVKILDHDGNGLTVARDGSGRVASVTDASGRVYTFSYYADAYGLLWKVSDFAGRYVEYTWDTGVSNVRLKTVRDVRGGITTYNYALQNPTVPLNPPTAQFLLTSIVDPRLNTARTFTYTDKVYGNWGADSASDALGNTWHFVYCANQASSASCSNGAAQVDPTGATSFETRMTPPLGAGAATTTRFDTGGRLIAQVDANAKTSTTTPTPLASLTNKTYNLAALPTKKQSALGVTGSFGTDYTYTPDNAGNLATQKDAENATTMRTWLTGTAQATALVAKNLHRVSRFAAATGAEHAFTHTDSGNVQTYTPPGLPAIELIYDPAAAGQVTGIKDGRNNTSTREYDAHGNLLKAIDPVPATGPTLFVENTYDLLGRVLTSTDKRGAITTNTWDEAGNLKSVKDALNGTVAYEYDANGNRTKMLDARNNVTNYSYDTANRLKTVSRINGAQTFTTTSNYDVMGRVSSTVNANSHADSSTFDGEGNVLTRANALLDTTSYVYDDDNRVTKTTDPAGRVTDTSYDKVGRVKTVTTTAGTTSYEYDADGRMTQSTDPRSHATQYAYDAAGRLTTLTDANNQITRATFDANGNMLTVVDPNTRTTTYSYDTLNRPLTRTDANGQQWSTTYDENGNVKTQTVPGPAGPRTTTFTYDALNRVSSVAYPDASVVGYTYDANGNRKTMTDSTGTTNYSYDALNRMTSKIDPQGKTVSYTYDGVGNVTTLGYPGGQSVSYAYDAGERLTSLTDWLNKTTSYTLNRAGQVTTALFGNNTRADMVYDTAGRQTSLINTKADSSILSSHGLTLDANGNITASTTTLPLQPSLPNVNRAFTYDSANRLATYNGGAVAHDVAGRITALAGDTYSYNDRDQITTISGTQTASHAYNGEGHRVTRTLNGQTTRFVIDPNRGLPDVLAETDNAGNVLRNYVYGYGLVEQIDSAGAAHYYHFDPTGSTLALTNAAGAVTDSYAYTPYGETTGSGSTVNPFRYVGDQGVMDDGNGLHYMRARFYRPDVARFMSLDQLAGDVDRPQSLNRYAYALGNPVMGVDPSGMAASTSGVGSPCYSGIGTTCVTTSDEHNGIKASRPDPSKTIVYTAFEIGFKDAAKDIVEGCSEPAEYGTYWIRCLVGGAGKLTGQALDNLNFPIQIAKFNARMAIKTATNCVPEENSLCDKSMQKDLIDGSELIFALVSIRKAETTLMDAGGSLIKAKNTLKRLQGTWKKPVRFKKAIAAKYEKEAALDELFQVLNDTMALFEKGVKNMNNALLN